MMSSLPAKNMATSGTTTRVEPVFFKNSDVLTENNQWLSVNEICKACSLVVVTTERERENNPIEGAQKIGDLWRIYLKDQLARVKLLSYGITLRGQQIELKERNPFTIMGYKGIETTRLFIRNIPLSLDNNEKIEALKVLGVGMVNTMKVAIARDPDGKLKKIKTGDRFVDMVVPDDPLPKKLPIGIFTASLYHKEQHNSKKECGNCMMKGDLRKNCPNEVVCYVYRNVGHKKSDPECPSIQENEIEAVDDDTAETKENESDDNGDDSESENEREKEEKRVSQMLSEALSAAEGLKSNQVKEQAATRSAAQTLMDAFVSGNRQPVKPGSRSASPASIRKLADRSPDIGKDLKKKDKKNKKK